jgi:hypothetical protein
MFSKTEREFLQGKNNPTNAHKRFLKYKIKKKLKEFYQFELPLLQNTNVSEFANGVSEFTHMSRSDGILESLERGTNPRPNAYEAFALPG